jgi:ankyrin repeat protein
MRNKITYTMNMVPEILEMLLHRRSDFLKHVDSDGCNALHYAAQNDNAKMVEMLLLKDPSLAYDNNHWGQPPLHVAVEYGSRSAIKAILRHCPDTAEQVICFEVL